jgi:hypothetical protein
MEKE